ncbi:sarcolemmal membrane-associated protein [Drosophila pseudoobscura]|uniref:Sarcolemmal membrane-associated protein n=1 Tax=Drosophila pseudoobscura pseudoobscura TaxID=46245 RepID=A0A6I8VXZ6_DROPS|nr:sarcolemmal membrane-associated protein [Drosophila pseudoobscura]XP_015036865.2 sarcolemmal membrane-associated protein [Drosophila pseudoobscura]XP_015036866.2 sarcolemmal membrane-associated protein [Drosophila pseudoobscura]XP_033235843.1 sarcolemmal membrane-associated protein [Drosophila pseudoobscura]XP_033235844.1 sarcolemmal membrane-associated protein [Drosophila pseudoobscura]
MVLVSNEWLNNKDDEQKTDPATSTTASGAVGSPTVSNGGASTETAARGSLASVRAAVGGGGGGASTVKRKKSQSSLNMDSTNTMKSEQDLVQSMEREKHELETADSNNEDESDENQENNNVEGSDSNTNTLQGTSTPDRRMASQLPASSQVLQMTLNSVLNANNTAVGGGVLSASSLFSSLGGHNNGVMQREQREADYGTLLVAQTQTQTLTQTPGLALSSTDLNMSPETASASVTAKGEAKIVLQCEAKSHKFETRSILLQPNQECKVGRLIAKSKASEENAIFDCKVLSRNHAMLWYTQDGRFWVKDTKSSNGTFINDNKLGNDPAELHFGDTVKFGVEVIENSRQEVHGCIIARVTLFMPDGREAISIDSDQLQLLGPNRISFDEIQRLNSFLQEAAQREKTLKAKLNSLQGVLDATRKNSAMCWQSMITEDQLIHKINLLEKKLQMMEKNVPENALRNEIVKMLEDKTTYQLTAKEALRKVYQERCDAMQALSRAQLANETSENECVLLRAQIGTSKQTLQDFNARLEKLQQEYLDYKKESLRQQQEAKKQEEERLEQQKEQLEREMDDLRLQVVRLQKTIDEHDSEQKLQEQSVLQQLDAAIPDDDDDEYEDNSDDESMDEAQEKDSAVEQAFDMETKEQATTGSGNRKSKTPNQQIEFDNKKKVIRRSQVKKLLQNSDLNRGALGADVLKAILNDFGSEDEDQEQNEEIDVQELNMRPELSAGIKREAAKAASDEFIHNSPKHARLNGIDEMLEHPNSQSQPVGLMHKLKSQEMLVRDEEIPNIEPDFPTDQAIEMLQEECDSYKQKTVLLTSDIHSLKEQMDKLKQQLEQEIQRNAHTEQPKTETEAKDVLEAEADAANEPRQASGQDKSLCLDTEKAWDEDLAAINDSQVVREEELIVYKERLEQSESSNLQLNNEILQLRLKLKHEEPQNLLFLYRLVPLGCLALAGLLYFLSIRI